MRRLILILMVLMWWPLAASAQMVSPGGGNYTGAIQGGSCLNPNFVQAISSVGAVTCATPAGGGGGSSIVGQPNQIVGFSAINNAVGMTVTGDLSFTYQAPDSYVATVTAINGAPAGPLVTATVGTGLTLTGGSLSLTAPVSVANGGTGYTGTATSPQILIAQTSGAFHPELMSGDVTITAAGVATVHSMGGATGPFMTQSSPTFTGTMTGVNINLTGALTFNGTAVGGSCPTGQLVNSLSATLVPGCVPITSGNGIIISGGVISLAAPVSVANGGMGSVTVTPAAGMIPIALNPTNYVARSISGDATLSSAGVITVNSINGVAGPFLPLSGGTITGNVIFSSPANISYQTGTTVSFGSGVNGITATPGTNSTLFATTAFVTSAIAALPTGPWLPVNNPTYTGVMTGPQEVNTGGTNSLVWGGGPTTNISASFGTGYGSGNVASSFLIGQNAIYVGGTPNAWQRGGTAVLGAPTASTLQMYGPATVITGNTGLSAVGTAFTPNMLFSISPVAYSQSSFMGNQSIPVGAQFWLPELITVNSTTNVTLLDMTANIPATAAVVLANNSTATGGIAEVYYTSNDAGEYGATQLTNTNWNIGGPVTHNEYVLGTSAAGGEVFNSAVGPTFHWWAPFGSSQGGGSTQFMTAGTQGGVGAQANALTVADAQPGAGSYAAVYVNNDLNHYSVMQIQSSNNTDNGPNDSTIIQQTTTGGVYYNSLSSQLTMNAGGQGGFSSANFIVSGYGVGSFNVANNVMVGLSLPGYAARSGNGGPNISNTGYPALSIGNSYQGGNTFANWWAAGASYYNPPSGQWFSDGGGGNGAALLQLNSGCIDMYNVGSLPGGAAIPWTVIGQWCGSGAGVEHISNLQTAPVPKVSSGALAEGSRDTFGWIMDVKGGQTTLIFAQDFESETACTPVAAGQPNLWFDANESSKQVTFACVVPWTGEPCADGAWLEYHCFALGSPKNAVGLKGGLKNMRNAKGGRYY